MSMSKMNQVLIRAAVERALADIQKNSARMIRNLVDLGERFASGQHQKEFFQIAQSELENPQSPYYRLVERVLVHTRPEHLLGFGMNLIYEGWTVNARRIRQIEEREGYNVPWALLYDAEHWTSCDSDLIRAAVQQGRTLGIGCHILRLGDNAHLLAEFLPLLRAHKDTVWLLFLSPCLLTDTLLKDLLELPRVLTVWDLADAAAGDNLRQLDEQGLLYGAYCDYQTFPQGEAGRRLQEQAWAWHSPLLVLWGNEDDRRYQPDLEEALFAWRKSLTLPVAPLDFYQDVLRVDRNISSEGCLVWLQEDGSLRCYTEDGTCYDSIATLGQQQLAALLRQLLPKGQSSSALFG